MEIDFNDITPLDLRILNHLRKNSITDEWEPLYDYLVNNFNSDPEDIQKIILIYSDKENKNIDFKDVNNISIPNFDYSSYDTKRLAFAEFIDVDPVFVKPFESYLSHHYHHIHHTILFHHQNPQFCLSHHNLNMLQVQIPFRYIRHT